MEHKSRKNLLVVLMLGILLTGHFYVRASEVDMEGTEGTTMEETVSDDVLEEEAEHTELTASTEEASEATTEEATPEGTATETDGEQVTGEGKTEEEITEEGPRTDVDTGEMEKVLEELFASIRYQNGLPYFLNKYQYDCEITYMKKYIAYLEMQIKIYQEMYELGEVTETMLQSYMAQKELAEAELQTAQNESAYYNLYITENKLDYSDYDVRLLKAVKGIEYYRENYPEKNYMTIARYVTDYNNAVTYIQAKQVEVASLKRSVAMSKMLLEEGELSEIEYMESEVSLARAEYELEQYYVSMNMAYVNIVSYCR